MPARIAHTVWPYSSASPGAPRHTLALGYAIDLTDRADDLFQVTPG